MGSLDVDSHFTNIPLDETIDTCVNYLFENTNTGEGFTKPEPKQLLYLRQQRSPIFILMVYKQIDGVVMGSPLGPSLVNTRGVGSFFQFEEGGGGGRGLKANFKSLKKRRLKQ